MPTNTEYKILKKTRYKNLTNWSIYFILSNAIDYNKNYNFAKIGDFLKRNKTPIKIDDSVIYKRPTIRLYNKGINLRDETLGKNIGTKNQFLIKEGQFLLSKIDARNGAFGVVPKDCDNAIITGNFWTFDVDYSKINPHFLSLLTGTKKFYSFCQSASAGTTNRNYLQENLFLEFLIPIPELGIQNMFVEKYNKKINEANLLEEKAESLASSIHKYLLKELGLLRNNIIFENGLQFVRYKDISRWDIWNLTILELSSIYKNVKLKKLISLNSGKFLPKKDQKEGPFPVYGGNGINGFHNLYNYEGERIIIGRVGEYCGNIHLVNDKYWITDNAFNCEKISDELSNQYLALALKAIDLNRFKILSAQPSISQNQIYELSIPIPNKTIQKRIVGNVSAANDKISSIKHQANILREQAITEFEKELFVS